MTKTHSELVRLGTFEERYHYLALRGTVGEATFGFDRWINQAFYRSKQWRDIRHAVIVRDEGCDLGFPGREIHSRPIIHHMNPMIAEEIAAGDEDILNPEYLITTTHKTHNAIHYGDVTLLATPFKERKRNDTKLW